MKGITGYEKIALALTAVFAIACAAVLYTGRSADGYTVSVSERTPESVLQAGEQQEKDYPDSLIPGELICVNTAPPLDLARLPGIGETRAEAIAAFRVEHGPFRTPEDLLQVNGIGAVTLEKIRPYITFG